MTNIKSKQREQINLYLAGHQYLAYMEGQVRVFCNRYNYFPCNIFQKIRNTTNELFSYL